MDWIWIRIPIRIGLQHQTLDPDPDPEKMNTDPQPWCQVQAALEAGDARLTSYLSGVNTHCIVRLSL